MLHRPGLTIIAALAILTAACSGDWNTAPNALPSRDESGATFIDQFSTKRGGGPGTAAIATVQVSDGIDTVLVLKRSSVLAADVSVTRLIGPHGGEIRLPATGARIVFPPGALREATSITMTAKRGWNVAYEFAPHGIAFDVPVSIEQDLRFTLAGKIDSHDTSIQAGYFVNLDASFIDPWKLFAQVSEVRRVRKVEPKNPHVVHFEIIHFSGYLMSSGFKGHGVGNGGLNDDSEYSW